MIRIFIGYEPRETVAWHVLTHSILARSSQPVSFVPLALNNLQGLMWRAINADGTLTYTFVESVKATYPFYVIRMAGGLLYLTGMVIMLWNVVKTATSGNTVSVAIPAPAHA